MDPCHWKELMAAASVKALVAGVSMVDPGSAGWKCVPSLLHPKARPPTRALPSPKQASHRYDRYTIGGAGVVRVARTRETSDAPAENTASKGRSAVTAGASAHAFGCEPSGRSTLVPMSARAS